MLQPLSNLPEGRRKISGAPGARRFGSDFQSERKYRHPSWRVQARRRQRLAPHRVQDIADIEDGGIAALAISDVTSIGRQPIGDLLNDIAKFFLGDGVFAARHAIILRRHVVLACISASSRFASVFEVASIPTSPVMRSM